MVLVSRTRWLLCGRSLVGLTPALEGAMRKVFYAGSAEITLRLVKIDETWMIEGFNVGSGQVMDDMVGRGT
jgi:hypothetical protein